MGPQCLASFLTNRRKDKTSVYPAGTKAAARIGVSLPDNHQAFLLMEPGGCGPDSQEGTDNQASSERLAGSCLYLEFLYSVHHGFFCIKFYIFNCIKIAFILIPEFFGALVKFCAQAESLTSVTFTPALTRHTGNHQTYKDWGFPQNSNNSCSHSLIFPT